MENRFAKVLKHDNAFPLANYLDLVYRTYLASELLTDIRLMIQQLVI